MRTDWDHSTQADDLLYDSAVCNTVKLAAHRPVSPAMLPNPRSHSDHNTDVRSDTPLRALPRLDSRRMSLARPAGRWRYPAWLRILESLPSPAEAAGHFVRSRVQHQRGFRLHRDGTVWLMSFLVHLILLVLLGVLTVAVHNARSTRILVLRADRPTVEVAAAVVLAPLTSETWNAFQPSGDGGQAVEGVRTGLSGTRGGRPASSARLTGPVDDVRALFAQRDVPLTPAATEGDGAEFFGIRAAGKGFVFVVDSSRSMTGRRWADACAELIYSVRRLGQDKSFYVIFFDGQAHPMFHAEQPEQELLPATDENVRRLEEWIARMHLGEETRPCAAVQLAMQLQPDALFLLSDGEFADQTAMYLRHNNFVDRGSAGYASGVVVHTIGFHSRKGQAVLQRIARENRGRYHFVSASQGLADLSRN